VLLFRVIGSIETGYHLPLSFRAPIPGARIGNCTSKNWVLCNFTNGHQLRKMLTNGYPMTLTIRLTGSEENDELIKM
jgi:hypothetical protein